jgi:hypothetical protein
MWLRFDSFFYVSVISFLEYLMFFSISEILVEYRFNFLRLLKGMLLI